MGAADFPGLYSLFVVVLELAMNAGRIGWADRVADVWDAATDAAGAFCGLLISMVFWRK